MPICEKCGKDFEEWKAESDFEDGVGSPLPLCYDQFGKMLCGDCAIEEYHNGNYFETCECCGKRFHPDEEYFNFQNQVSHRMLDADMYENGIHCADCAAKQLLDELENDEIDEDDHF